MEGGIDVEAASEAHVARLVSSGRFVRFPRGFAQVTGGDATAALVLCELLGLYYAEKSPGVPMLDGVAHGGLRWVHHRQADLALTLGVSRDAVKRAMGKLRGLGLIETFVALVGDERRATHYRPVAAVLGPALDGLFASEDARSFAVAEPSASSVSPGNGRERPLVDVGDPPDGPNGVSPGNGRERPLGDLTVGKGRMRPDQRAHAPFHSKEDIDAYLDSNTPPMSPPAGGEPTPTEPTPPKPRRKRPAIPMPDQWEPAPETIDRLIDQGLDYDDDRLAGCLAHFADNCAAHDRRYVDWDAAFRNWARSDIRRRDHGRLSDTATAGWADEALELAARYVSGDNPWADEPAATLFGEGTPQ